MSPPASVNTSKVLLNPKVLLLNPHQASNGVLEDAQICSVHAVHGDVDEVHTGGTVAPQPHAANRSHLKWIPEGLWRRRL